MHLKLLTLHMREKTLHRPLLASYAAFPADVLSIKHGECSTHECALLNARSVFNIESHMNSVTSHMDKKQKKKKKT